MLVFVFGFFLLLVKFLELSSLNEWFLKGFFVVGCMFLFVFLVVILIKVVGGNEVVVIFNLVFGSFLGIFVILFLLFVFFGFLFVVFFVFIVG